MIIRRKIYLIFFIIFIPLIAFQKILVISSRPPFQTPHQISNRKKNQESKNYKNHDLSLDRQIKYVFPRYERCTQYTQYQQPQKSHNRDRKSTRLNSSHVAISYAVFCLKKKKKKNNNKQRTTTT